MESMKTRNVVVISHKLISRKQNLYIESAD